MKDYLDDGPLICVMSLHLLSGALASADPRANLVKTREEVAVSLGEVAVVVSASVKLYTCMHAERPCIKHGCLAGTLDIDMVENVSIKNQVGARIQNLMSSA